jgi:hypothetical protein
MIAKTGNQPGRVKAAEDRSTAAIKIQALE